MIDSLFDFFIMGVAAKNVVSEIKYCNQVLAYRMSPSGINLVSERALVAFYG